MDGQESTFSRVDGSAFQFILNAILPALFSSNLIKLTEFSSLLNSSITAAAVDNSSSSNDDNDTSNYFLSRDFGKDCFSISSFMTFVMVSVTSFFCHSSIILLLGIIIGLIAYFSIAQLLLQVWAVVVAQLVERSLLIPEVCSSNPVIGKNLSEQNGVSERSELTPF